MAPVHLWIHSIIKNLFNYFRWSYNNFSWFCGTTCPIIAYGLSHFVRLQYMHFLRYLCFQPIALIFKLKENYLKKKKVNYVGFATRFQRESSSKSSYLIYFFSFIFWTLVKLQTLNLTYTPNYTNNTLCKTQLSHFLCSFFFCLILFTRLCERGPSSVILKSG